MAVYIGVQCIEVFQALCEPDAKSRLCTFVYSSGNQLCSEFIENIDKTSNSHTQASDQYKEPAGKTFVCTGNMVITTDTLTCCIACRLSYDNVYGESVETEGDNSAHT